MSDSLFYLGNFLCNAFLIALLAATGLAVLASRLVRHLWRGGR